MRCRLAQLGVWLALAAVAGAQAPAPDAGQTQDKLRDNYQQMSRKNSEIKDQLKGIDLELGDSSKTLGDPRHLVAGPFGDRFDLSTPWLFNSGSEPAFASPAYDDSGWQVIDTTKPMFTSMLFGLNQVWYRKHVHITPGAHSLALTIAEFGGSYRIYVNGRELGGHGKMSGRGDFLVTRSDTYPIPNDVAAQQDLVLAIHGVVGATASATYTLGEGLGRTSAVYLGPQTVLDRDQRAYVSPGATESSTVLTLWAVLLLLAVGLAILIPRTPIYALLAVYAGGHLAARLMMNYAALHYLARTHWSAWLILLATIVSDLALLEVCRNLAGNVRRHWFTAIEAVYVLSAVTLLPAALGWISYAMYSFVSTSGYYLLLMMVVFLVGLGVRRHKQDAYTLAAVGAVFLLHVLFWELLHYIVFSFAFLTRMSDWYQHAFVPLDTVNFAIVFGFVTLILVRTLRIVRERASIANEIEAARTMQQLLLGQSNQATPGFVVESVYLPAGEVGGDFFLVSPCLPEGAAAGEDDASITVIVGDVSGKGMRAAMRVSMILGVLRREPSREPVAMLEGLNQALHAEGDTGFTTACCVRLARDGRFTVANAGHISPYVAGVEMETAPALPLGLAPGQEFAVTAGRLLPGQRLVLMSDGVAEARTSKGELYGFDRLAPLTLRPAAEIAHTAQKFGQDDDITVLTMACLPRTTNIPPPPGKVAPPPPPPPPPPRP